VLDIKHKKFSGVEHF